jgi:16S rRNA (adenine1518-N6/adenine1519-N6)-dimethyltransferase
MEKKSLRPNKALGQNFLMHARIAERIARVAGVENAPVVLEIGPGTGMLTRELLKVAKKVVAVETDKELFEKLQTDFAEEITNGRLALVNSDIRAFDILSLPRGYALVANIPYYITGEIFRMFLESENQPNSMTLLVQKEVAVRIVANPERGRAARAKKESILSLSIKAYGTPKLEFSVPRGAFVPAPKVDSAVLSIAGISRKNFATKEEEEKFFTLLHAGFAHKRKLVRNNLTEAGLSAGTIPEKARAEDLSLATWLALVKS